jgi:hypothetical protein
MHVYSSLPSAALAAKDYISQHPLHPGRGPWLALDRDGTVEVQCVTSKPRWDKAGMKVLLNVFFGPLDECRGLCGSSMGQVQKAEEEWASSCDWDPCCLDHFKQEINFLGFVCYSS